MAMTGLITGYLGLVIYLALVVIIIVMIVQMS